MRSTYIHPTNNFGNHNNVNFYHWTAAIIQGKYWNNFVQLTSLEVRNNLFDEEIVIENLHLVKGRTDSAPEIGKVLKPGVPFSFDLAPAVHDSQRIIQGAVVVRGKRSGKQYALGFEGDLLKHEFRAGLVQGDWHYAVSQIGKTSSRESWGSCEILRSEGKLPNKFVLKIGN